VTEDGLIVTEMFVGKKTLQNETLFLPKFRLKLIQIVTKFGYFDRKQSVEKTLVEIDL